MNRDFLYFEFFNLKSLTYTNFANFAIQKFKIAKISNFGDIFKFIFRIQIKIICPNSKTQKILIENFATIFKIEKMKPKKLKTAHA